MYIKAPMGQPDILGPTVPAYGYKSATVQGVVLVAGVDYYSNGEYQSNSFQWAAAVYQVITTGVQSVIPPITGR